MEKKNDHHVPFSLTPEYDRSACKDCRCAFCYQQEFCDHCSHCNGALSVISRNSATTAVIAKTCPSTGIIAIGLREH